MLQQQQQQQKPPTKKTKSNLQKNPELVKEKQNKTKINITSFVISFYIFEH